ncbi:MAG: hypothetical protein SOW25_01650 [Helicobacter sp.]|nr:hypothetical protein [Helicobacteraceae bacterium]MDY3113016.1 hypothetical protein [Helicobacter sp.]
MSEKEKTQILNESFEYKQGSNFYSSVADSMNRHLEYLKQKEEREKETKKKEAQNGNK